MPGYYPGGNDFMPPSFGPFFGTPDHGQGTQPGNATQSFNANPNNMFFGTQDHGILCMQQFILQRN